MIQLQTKKPELVNLTALRGKTIPIKKDFVIYSPKDEADCFFLVLEGSVELSFQIDSTHSFTKLIKKGEYFGFDEIFEPSNRISKATALEDSTFFKLELNEQIQKPVNKQIKEQYIQTAGMLSRSGNSMFSVKDSIRAVDKEGIKIVEFLNSRGSLYNALQFKNYLFNLIDMGNTNLIVSLSACKSIDSTFLGTLIASLKKISGMNGKMSLVCKSEMCSWLFLMTKMEKVFQIFNSLEDAIASIKETSNK